MVVHGKVQNGHVVPIRPLGLPEGYDVLIISSAPIDRQRHVRTLDRIRARAVGISLPDRAFTTESLYEDPTDGARES